MTQLFEKAELTEVEASDLMAKLKEKMDRVTDEVTKHAESPQEADCVEVGEVYTWPMCNVCTFMNEVRSCTIAEFADVVAGDCDAL